MSKFCFLIFFIFGGFFYVGMKWVGLLVFILFLGGVNLVSLIFMIFVLYFLIVGVCLRMVVSIIMGVEVSKDLFFLCLELVMICF